MVWILVFLWWFSGAAGFVYWWTSDNDVTLLQLPLVFGAGCIGPISWVVGYSIHGDNPGVIIKKRRK